MITVIGVWEPGYSDEQMFFENTVWNQTLSAFAVDRFIMVAGDNPIENITQPEQVETMADALALVTAPLVFITYPAEGAEPLKTFVHPADAVYIFGCPSENLMAYIQKGDYQVHLDTPNNVDLLACSIVAAVLYGRLNK